MDCYGLNAKIKNFLRRGKRKIKRRCGGFFLKTGRDFLFGGLLFFILLIFWIPTINLPYWWDSIYLTQSAFQFLETNFSPLISEYGDFAHPPFLMVLLALVWKVFGESLFVSHFLMLIFTFLALFYTYLLGKQLVEDKVLGRWIGFFSAFLLLISPVFLAQVGIVYFEIPVTAFCVMAVYYFLRGRKIGYIICATLMLWTKEVSGVVVGLILVVILFERYLEYLKSKKLDWKEVARETGFILSPFFFLFLWFAYHRLVSGWWMIRPGREFGGGAAFSLSRVPNVLRFVFLSQGRVILTVFTGIIVAGLLYREDYRNYFKKRTVVLISLIPFVVAVFFGLTEFLHRYVLFGLPFFFLSGLYFSFKILEKVPGLGKLEGIFKTTALGFLVIALFYLSYASWDNHREVTNWSFSPLEENLEYQDIVKVGQEVVEYVEKNHADNVIWTSFPANYMLADPRQHFTSKDIEVKNCDMYQKGDKVEIVVFHVFSPVSQHCLALIRGLNLSLLTPFAHNGKWMQVFQNPELVE